MQQEGLVSDRSMADPPFKHWCLAISRSPWDIQDRVLLTPGTLVAKNPKGRGKGSQAYPKGQQNQGQEGKLVSGSE